MLRERTPSSWQDGHGKIQWLIRALQFAPIGVGEAREESWLNPEVYGVQWNEFQTASRSRGQNQEKGADSLGASKSPAKLYTQL